MRAVSWWGRRVLTRVSTEAVGSLRRQNTYMTEFTIGLGTRMNVKGIHGGATGGGVLGVRGGSGGRHDGRSSQWGSRMFSASRLGVIATVGATSVVWVFGEKLSALQSTHCEGWYVESRDKAKGRDKDAMPIAETDRQILDYYELLEELGSGVHAAVRMGKNKETGERVAVKCVDKANMRRRQLAREIEILTTVNHPNVISLKDVFEDSTYVYLVLELVEVSR